MFTERSGHGSLEDQFMADCGLMNTIATQMSVDSLFPSDIRLLPPDICRQLELDAQQIRSPDANKYGMPLVLSSIIKYCPAWH